MDELAQSLVLAPDARILIAVSDPLGRLPKSHSLRSSRTAIDQAPPGWEKSEVLSLPDPEQPGSLGHRDGWLWSKGKTKVVLVPHEWGVEILVAIAAGVATEAIIQLTKYIWSRWVEQRATDGQEIPLLRLQVIRKTTRKGNSHTIQTLEIGGSASPGELTSILKNGMALLSQEVPHNPAVPAGRKPRNARFRR